MLHTSVWSSSDPRKSIGNDIEIIVVLESKKHPGDTLVRVAQIDTDETESIVWFCGSGGVPRIETEETWPSNWYWTRSPIGYKED